MPGRNLLFVPGPTNVPERVLRAMHRAMEDHRSSDFPALTGPVFEDLKKIFKTTSGQAFVFPSSGTGAWEAALSNTRSSFLPTETTSTCISSSRERVQSGSAACAHACCGARVSVMARSR